MLCEIVNSLFLTFLATEYLISSENNNSTRTKNDVNDADHHNKNHHSKNNALRNIFRFIRQFSATIASRHSRPIQYSFMVAVVINIFAHFHVTGLAISQWIHGRVEGLFHIPRVLIAMISFSVALYWDCRRVMGLVSSTNSSDRANTAPAWSNGFFFRLLLKSFCRLLPIYPFLAVLISFGFLFVVSFFEKMNLSTHILNNPIYYGTLYGPLSLMYWDVKKGVLGGATKYDGNRLGREGGVLPR